MMKNCLLLLVLLLPIAAWGGQTLKVPEEILAFLNNKPAANTISATELLKKIQAGEKLTLIDVRTPGEYAVMHPKGAINIPYETLADQLNKIPRDRLVVALCHSGRRAEGATTVLRILGFDNVVNLSGGIKDLAQALTPKTAPAPVKNQGPAEDDPDAEPDMGC